VADPLASRRDDTVRAKRTWLYQNLSDFHAPLPRKLETRLSTILFAMSRMPDKDSQYKKVVFKEDRVPKGRSLPVIIEILQTAKSNRTDVSDLAMIEFAYKLVENRIMNEEWGHCDKSAKSISFGSLPSLYEPTHKEGNLIAWVVE